MEIGERVTVRAARRWRAESWIAVDGDELDISVPRGWFVRPRMWRLPLDGVVLVDQPKLPFSVQNHGARWCFDFPLRVAGDQLTPMHPTGVALLFRRSQPVPQRRGWLGRRRDPATAATRPVRRSVEGLTLRGPAPERIAAMLAGVGVEVTASSEQWLREHYPVITNLEEVSRRRRLRRITAAAAVVGALVMSCAQVDLADAHSGSATLESAVYSLLILTCFAPFVWSRWGDRRRRQRYLSRPAVTAVS